jgi:hypothetical protein
MILFQLMLFEVQMINDKIIHKVKDDLLKQFELNPNKIDEKLNYL